MSSEAPSKDKPQSRRPRGDRRRPKQQQQRQPPPPSKQSDDGCDKTILVLHGNRQTGQLLLGRMEKLRKALRQEGIKLVAPDAPFDHPEDPNLRQWWDRHDNTYRGLETSLQLLHDFWENSDSPIIGLLGFSQGARLAQLITLLHHTAQEVTPNAKLPFSGLQFAIFVTTYDRPLPDNWNNTLHEFGITIDSSKSSPLTSTLIRLPTLHIWGATDPLIPPQDSQEATKSYLNPKTYEHEGGHHVPMKNPSILAYLEFVKHCLTTTSPSTSTKPIPASPQSIIQKPPPVQEKPPPPDEETAQAQQDEVEALTAIYPDEVTLLSKVSINEETGETIYQHPISYRIALHPEEDSGRARGHWPKRPLALGITYPPQYPSEEALPDIRLVHDNNVMEFPSAVAAACVRAIQEAAEAERGMPCVLSCLYAAKEFLDSGQLQEDGTEGTNESVKEPEAEEEEEVEETRSSSLLKEVSPERIRRCNLEGLAIAEALLGRSYQSPPNNTTTTTTTKPVAAEDSTPLFSGKGGSWTYTIGLVGKPSAGKSTLFNAASGFARQRGDTDNALGGAAMAARPFTTIDPNLGFCLVPAPDGSCPEEGVANAAGPLNTINIGCSHGRDAKGRRLLPVLLKDVAGLVPGAYQGRGRGNKFLNDLTDADVLIHVVDASGTADSEGNTVGEDDDNDTGTEAPESGEMKPSQPLEDLAWVRNELCEWVFNNVAHKWDSVKRRGRSKLAGLFSGYGQTSAVVSEVMLAVEKYIEKTEGRDRALDHMEEWDAGDVHRLVSAFLGVRFPMALALNKYDLPSSTKHVEAIQSALPIHGAHVGVPLCARSEMSYIRYHMLQQPTSSTTSANKDDETTSLDRRIPLGTWQCLQSAMSLREPVLVFPVNDMTTYQPLPGMQKHAIGDPSLPSPGMIACLQASGGSAPTLWDPQQRIYAASSGTHAQKAKQICALRDCLLMKPGSTVEDVFFALKRLGALGGEFVRAEGAGALQETSKQIRKDAVVTRRCCILKIMTTKRSPWQQQQQQLK